MSSSRNAVFVVLSSFALAGAGGLAVTACSSSSTADATAADSGAAETSAPKGRPDSGAVDPDAGTPQTAQQCYDACLAAHPAAKTQYAAVDKCWVDNCQGPCLNQSGTFDGGADAGLPGLDAGTDGGDAGDAVCGTTVGTGQDKACDQCTSTFCCSQWSSCYGAQHDECLAIDDCIAKCP